jgi:predicted ester cyclase
MKARFFYCLLGVTLFIAIHSCGDNKGSTTATESTGTDTLAAKAEETTKKNIEMTKSFYSYFNSGDWAAVEKLIGPELTDHGPMAGPSGTSKLSRDSLMKLIKMNKEAFPDMKFEVLNAAADADLVFIQYRFTGTNTGSMMGQPATNKKVDYTGVDLVRIQDGVAVEHWDYGDNVSFMKQMGMIPEPKQQGGKKK